MIEKVVCPVYVNRVCQGFIKVKIGEDEGFPEIVFYFKANPGSLLASTQASYIWEVVDELKRQTKNQVDVRL